jgi:hypothetical protein
MSLFGDDFPEYRNPVMIAGIDFNLPPVIQASVDAICQAEEAHRALVERAESSWLTVGQIRDHLAGLVLLAASIEGHNFETLAQIADAILVLQADLGEQLDGAS